ncbi:NB-ARC domain-containing protein [Nonomuraea sp. NPDC049655]|uniref:NB-ARC domain-containing protein n=1 Tax=Nonomuraea sp. NPDC049655 TaxID=3364355 RepID=UPI00379B5E83
MTGPAPPATTDAALFASLAAIRAEDGTPVGAGFLVTAGHVLTCAHVVNAALGEREDEDRRPMSAVYVDFPLVAPGHLVAADVRAWSPIDGTGAGDCALLTLRDAAPEQAGPAPLRAPGDVWGHSFRTFGFPRGHGAGLWATGRIRGPQGNGWIQLEDIKTPGAAVERGFSGGAVYDEELRAVVGMVVAQDLQQGRKIAFMLPTALLGRLIPELAALSPEAVPAGPLYNVPGPPPHHRPRPEDFERLRQAVLAEAERVVDGGQKIAVHGMGGVGKSVLAAAVARDDQVRRCFPDGVLWVELGPQASLPERQAQLAAALGVSQAVFVDVQYGRAGLSRALADRRCLIVADNVWHAEQIAAFDVLGPRCRLLFTTRDAGLARASGADGVLVSPLTDEQATALLAGWAGHSLDELPPEADEVVRECGNLPLALAMAGAMAEGRPERWPGVLRRLRESDLGRIRQNFPHYPHPDLLQAIEAGVLVLEPHARERYLELAVFAGRVVPAQVVELLWAPVGVDDLETEELLDLFVERSLARVEGPGVRLHDLQSDYVAKQLTDVPALHARLLDSYTASTRDGRAGGSVERYFFENLAHHLRHAEREDELRMLLLDLAWLSAKLAATDVTYLLADFAGVDDAGVVLVRDALRLSSHALARDPGQLSAQLVGRLAGVTHPAVVALVEQARTWPTGSRLRPLGAGLIAPAAAMGGSLVGHASWIRTIALSADGRVAVSGGDDHTARVWHVDDGREVHTLRGHDGSVWSVAVTADGRTAVTGGVDGTLRVWNLADGTQQHVLTGHRGSVWTTAITPDSRLIVSGAADGTVRVWDLRDGRQRHVLSGHRGAVMSIRLSPDGRIVASGSEDGTARAWRVADGTPVANFDSGERWVQSATVALTEHHLLFGTDSGNLHIWRLDDGRRAFALNSGHGASWALAAAPDGRYAVVSSMDGPLTVWDLVSGSPHTVLHGHSGWVGALAVSSDGRTAVSGGDDGILRVWSLPSGGEATALRGHAGWVNAVALTADGRRAVSGSADGALRIWNLAGAAEHAEHAAHSGWVAALKEVRTGGAGVISVSDDSTVRVWDAATGTVRQTLRGHVGPVKDLTVLGTGEQAVTAGGDGTVRLWDLRTGRERRLWHASEQPVTAVCALGRHLAAGTGDGRLSLWDLRTGGLVREWDTGEPVQFLRAIGDGRRVVTAGAGGTVGVWDVASDRALQLCRGPGGPVLCLSPARDGELALAGCIDGFLTAWDLGTGRARWEIRAHETQLHAMTLLGSDAAGVATGGGDGAVRTWDLDTGGAIDEFVPTGEPVRAVASTAGGGLLVSGSGDEVTLWDTRARARVARFFGDSGISACLTLKVDDRMPVIACGEASGGVHLLQLRTAGN